MKHTSGTWIIDGEHIVSTDRNETICDINPETEYPTVGERSNTESLGNAKLICEAPNMYAELKNSLLVLRDARDAFKSQHCIILANECDVRILAIEEILNKLI